MCKSFPVITIDGPSSAGKGTLCVKLAQYLNWNLIDSGIIYRLIALIAINHKISFNDEKSLIKIAMKLNIKFKIVSGNLVIILKNKQVNEKFLRNEKVGMTASNISKSIMLRMFLLNYQRSFRKYPGLLADGRDMGTVVFPDANLKIFLHASIQERANRRMKQLRKYGFNCNLKNLLLKMKIRDLKDKNRKISPLIPAPDALIFDSSYLTIDEMTNKILKYIKQIINL
ncbi:MAG: (d)CMP kinase [Enterobacterales bacterium]